MVFIKPLVVKTPLIPVPQCAILYPNFLKVVIHTIQYVLKEVQPYNVQIKVIWLYFVEWWNCDLSMYWY